VKDAGLKGQIDKVVMNVGAQRQLRSGRHCRLLQ